jgi:thiamine transport system permease protein
VFTIWQALLSTLLTFNHWTAWCLPAARYEFRKSLLQALSVILCSANRSGRSCVLCPAGLWWINLALINLRSASLDRFTNTLAAILLAHVFYNTTIVLRMVGDYWSHSDPRMTQAARILGANRWHTFREITLPLLAPSIITASLLVFLFDFTSFLV